MQSIRKRLVVNFMVIILVTVFILEIVVINIVRHNYYKNLEENMFNQIRISTDLYYKYFSDSTLYENVLNNVDTFWKQSTSQVQIIDTSGEVIMDSIGAIPSTNELPDVKYALEGQKGTWIGKVNYDNEKVMAVSYPLESHDEIVGVLRFVSSLREVNKDVNEITLIFIVIGIIVIFISGILSFILANLMIEPIHEVTKVAEQMAQGIFTNRSKKKYNDEVGKLSDTINYMAEEIMKKDQLKNEFISSVSHELRTPLTSIKGWAITLKDDNIQDKQMLHDGLQIIEKESDRLTDMVEELLDFSKFVSGKIEMKREEVDIINVIQHIEKQLMPRAYKENIEFIVSYNEDIPVIISDGNRLKQLFINVLDNAFKFTPKGGKVSFVAELFEGKLIFTIEDTGCGISKEDLPKVKEKFFKGKNSNSKNGIGLSICDEIVILMKGTFKIQSEVNKGTKVIITIPLGE